MRNSSVLPSSSVVSKPGSAASAYEVGLDVVFRPCDVVDIIDGMGVVVRNFGLVDIIGGMGVVARNFGFSVEFLVLSTSSS